MVEQVLASPIRHKVPEGVIELSRAGQYLLMHPRLPRFAIVMAPVVHRDPAPETTTAESLPALSDITVMPAVVMRPPDVAAMFPVPLNPSVSAFDIFQTESTPVTMAAPVPVVALPIVTAPVVFTWAVD